MEQVTDNFHNDFPARMSDGRFITNYFPNCDINRKMKKEMSSFEYRKYLIENTETLMQEINSTNEKLFGCKNCHTTVIPHNHLKQVCKDNGVCDLIEVDPSGIGIDQSEE
tara:strand:+ start:4275 stop:4604 length:330 start_codon:yes stop_codon:yes gene_type:complete